MDDVGTVIRGLAGEPDVTVKISWAGSTDENVTDVESRYVVDIETAATAIKEWLSSGEESSLGWWERQ